MQIPCMNDACDIVVAALCQPTTVDHSQLAEVCSGNSGLSSLIPSTCTFSDWLRKHTHLVRHNRAASESSFQRCACRYTCLRSIREHSFEDIFPVAAIRPSCFNASGGKSLLLGSLNLFRKPKSRHCAVDDPRGNRPRQPRHPLRLLC